MTTEEFAQKIVDGVNRRKFLKRTGGGVLATTLALLGLESTIGATPALALVNYKCCHLCYSPTSACPPGLRCGWSWTCCFNHQLWRCLENHDSAPCDSSCGTTACSRAYVVGSC